MRVEFDRSQAYEFARRQGLAVLASTSDDGASEAALVEIAVTPDFEIIFDTIETTRKCVNLRRDPRVAIVFGGREATTLQLEGVADEPKGNEIDRLKAIFFATCANAPHREGWPGLTYFRVRPTWLRYSNYQRPRRVSEMTFPGAPVLLPRKRRWPFS